MSYIIQTKRIGLRNWVETDLDEFAEMNADEEVMRYFYNRFDKESSKGQLQKFHDHYVAHGYTYFATEELTSRQFIGFVGLLNQTYESPFTPCVDIGWRLKKAVWGKGYATEAAQACLDFAFAELQLTEIFSITPKLNLASARVMQKIGMQKHLEFQHPKIPDSSPLQTCLVYKVSA